MPLETKAGGGIIIIICLDVLIINVMGIGIGIGFYGSDRGRLLFEELAAAVLLLDDDIAPGEVLDEVEAV